MKRLAVLLVLLLACSRTIDRAQWQRMSPSEKTMVVRSLLGHEKVKERKGGNARVYPRDATDYVRRIDEAYARGDGRAVEVVFGEMGERR